MNPRARKTYFRLPGGRFAVANRAQVPRLAVAAASLLGPQARRRLRTMEPRQAERLWAEAVIARLGVMIEVSGLAHVDPAESYVVTPLHEGFADVPTLLAGLPLPLRFVARAELASWPILGDGLKSGDHPIVTPEGGATAYRTMRRAAKHTFAARESLVVFPQGTILGIEAGFTRGAFHLAAAAGRPVLPIVITGTHRVWEHPFSPLVRFDQSVSLQVLRPIAPHEAVETRRMLERTMKRLALSNPIPPRRFVPARDGWWDGYRFTIDSDFAELSEQVTNRRRGLRGGCDAPPPSPALDLTA